MIEIIVENIKKSYNRKIIFENINFTLSDGDGISITGKNGSGKSTLVKIISNLIEQTSGKIIYKIDSSAIEYEKFMKNIGFVSPYLNFYDEFTAMENILFLNHIRETTIEKTKIETMFELFGLEKRKDEFVRAFSSGMKQKLKYIFALSNKPKVLILDEPTSNLDEEGISIVQNIMKDQRESGNIIIVATNDTDDLKFCNSNLDLNRN